MGNQSKTAREWFEMLNEPERSQAIKNSKVGQRETFKTLENAISCSFDWLKTNEGAGFWQNLQRQVKNGTYPFKGKEEGK